MIVLLVVLLSGMLVGCSSGSSGGGGGAPTPPPTTGSISGVIQGPGGVPVAGATVKAIQGAPKGTSGSTQRKAEISATTDDLGKYSLSELNSGYTYNCQATGGTCGEQTQTSTVNFDVDVTSSHLNHHDVQVPKPNSGGGNVTFPNAPVLAEPVVSGSEVQLSWTLQTDANFQSYIVCRSTTPDITQGAVSLARIENSSARTFTDKVSSAGTYYYKVFLMKSVTSFPDCYIVRGSNEVKAAVSTSGANDINAFLRVGYAFWFDASMMQASVMSRSGSIADGTYTVTPPGKPAVNLYSPFGMQGTYKKYYAGSPVTVCDNSLKYSDYGYFNLLFLPAEQEKGDYGFNVNGTLVTINNSQSYYSGSALNSNAVVNTDGSITVTWTDLTIPDTNWVYLVQASQAGPGYSPNIGWCSGDIRGLNMADPVEYINSLSKIAIPQGTQRVTIPAGIFPSNAVIVIDISVFNTARSSYVKGATVGKCFTYSMQAGRMVLSMSAIGVAIQRLGTNHAIDDRYASSEYYEYYGDSGEIYAVKKNGQPAGKVVCTGPYGTMNLTYNAWDKSGTWSFHHGGSNDPKLGAYTFTAYENADGTGASAEITGETNTIIETVPTIIAPVSNGAVMTYSPIFQWQPLTGGNRGISVNVGSSDGKTMYWYESIPLHPDVVTSLMFREDYAGTALPPGTGTYCLTVTCQDENSNAGQRYREFRTTAP
ncbi:MAG: carboxypeptidase-like regulatory domain-containing protein [Syntrophales bacterium]|nr:carboxypeptidase-like regulatory domain-containing protein [Syntrophales bacterium]